jgi:hypothetical protein
LTCAICHIRKEKRFCLALHDRICPQCCGEQREVTLECPAECPYLQQARLHEKPRDPGDKPSDELFPSVELTEEFLRRHDGLISGLLQRLLQIAQADRALKDRDIINALTTMAHSYQTLISSGLVYQETSANPAQVAIIDTLRGSVEEVRKLEAQHLGYTALRDADVLRALVFMIRVAHLQTSGRPLSRAFLDNLREKFPASASASAPATESGSRIIIP